MKCLKIAICLFSTLIFLASCDKQENVTPTAEYKGKTLHAPIDLSLLPDSNLYSLNTEISGAVAAKLHSKVVTLIDTLKLTGITVSIMLPGEGIWHLDTGYLAKDQSKKIDSASVFYWMSVGKMVTSTIVTQLVKEGKLTFDTKLSNWYPEFQYAEQITINHLLTHTSGIYSFDADSTNSNATEKLPAEEKINVTIANKNLFKPGEYWKYNNTGYILLGDIIERIEGKTFPEIVSARISHPLKLKSLQALSDGEVPENLALAHKNGKVIQEDYAHGGAGNISGNSEDVLKFLYATLTGKLYQNQFLKSRVEQLFPMHDIGSYYGKGLMVWDFNEINKTNNYWLGHYGGNDNYQAIALYDTQTKAFITVSVNQKISVAAVANSLLSVLKQIPR